MQLKVPRNGEDLRVFVVGMRIDFAAGIQIFECRSKSFGWFVAEFGGFSLPHNSEGFQRSCFDRRPPPPLRSLKAGAQHDGQAAAVRGAQPRVLVAGVLQDARAAE